MSSKPKYSIPDMKILARLRKGQCLSVRYINSRTKLKWICDKSHIWKAAPDKIKQGRWCPICAGKQRLTIDEMQRRARRRGGWCLSRKYANNRTKLAWKCSEGHIWKTTPGEISSGYWCPACARLRSGSTQKLNISQMCELAKSKGGVCLSKVYINSHTRLRWKCKEGHAWEATPSKIRMGRWCPVCSSRISERICRRFFEKIFERPFPSQRPEWLKTEQGNRLELDGYCAALGVAFEYQGKQHYENIPFFNQTQKLVRRKGHDDLKKRLCKKHGVVLFCIPYDIAYEDLGEYIQRAVKQRGIRIRRKAGRIDYRKFNIYSPQKIIEMRLIAQRYGGRCLSEKYIKSNSKLSWRCKRNHVWEATPSNIKNGQWCPVCGGTKKLNIKDAKELALRKGGRCLSTEYRSARHKLLWRCAKGHKWYAAYYSIKSGFWCPHCSRNAKLTLLEMMALAKSRGGRCLSRAYINSKTNLRWECKAGHGWEAAPSSVKGGTWCKACAGLVKNTIQQMRGIATKRRGKCLSSTYANGRTKLLWQCVRGHRWEAIPGNVKRGSWCPHCAREASKP